MTQTIFNFNKSKLSKYLSKEPDIKDKDKDTN